MKLLVDVGNTTINFAFNKEDAIKPVLTVLVSEFKKSKKAILKLFKSKPEEIYISSVVPDVSKFLKKLFSKKIAEDKINFISPRDPVNFKIKIDNPDELGTDLLCDMEGAISKYKPPLLIIDVGTATKVMYMPKDKVFTSCVIIPGLEISLKLLSDKTALLSQEKLNKPKRYLDCHNTKDVLVSSVVYSQIDAIKGIVERYEKDIGVKTTKILTGGYNQFLNKYLEFDLKVDPLLAFEGIKQISRKKNI